MADRVDQEIATLNDIGNVLSSTLELREAFGKIMQNHFSKDEYASRGIGLTG